MQTKNTLTYVAAPRTPSAPARDIPTDGIIYLDARENFANITTRAPGQVTESGGGK